VRTAHLLPVPLCGLLRQRLQEEGPSGGPSSHLQRNYLCRPKVHAGGLGCFGSGDEAERCWKTAGTEQGADNCTVIVQHEVAQGVDWTTSGSGSTRNASRCHAHTMYDIKYYFSIHLNATPIYTLPKGQSLPKAQALPRAQACESSAHASLSKPYRSTILVLQARPLKEPARHAFLALGRVWAVEVGHVLVPNIPEPMDL